MKISRFRNKNKNKMNEKKQNKSILFLSICLHPIFLSLSSYNCSDRKINPKRRAEKQPKNQLKSSTYACLNIIFVEYCSNSFNFAWYWYSCIPLPYSKNTLLKKRLSTKGSQPCLILPSLSHFYLLKRVWWHKRVQQ